MNLIPTEEEVVALLEKTGALRRGHYLYPNGVRSNLYLQLALAMRSYQTARTLSVALSRKLRQNTELRAMIPQLSVVAPATGGLYVAYGIVEALRAAQVYWAEEDIEGQPQRFRQFVEPKPGEKILLVDDILRTGTKLQNLRRLVEQHGGEVVGVAVMVYQPTPRTPKFEDLPLYYLAKVEAEYFDDAAAERLAGQGVEFQKVWV